MIYCMGYGRTSNSLQTATEVNCQKIFLNISIYGWQLSVTGPALYTWWTAATQSHPSTKCFICQQQQQHEKQFGEHANLPGASEGV